MRNIMRKIRQADYGRVRAKSAALLGILILAGFGTYAPRAAAQDAPLSFEALPKGFHGVELGMTLAEVESALAKDDLFFYRGGPDVTLLPRPNEKLLEVQGLSYVKRAFFQFYEDKLFSAIYVLNTEKVDHYSVFTQLSNRYGKPKELSPKESVWTDGAVRVSLERPLTMKYLDVAVLERLRQAGETRQSYEDMSRQDFLDSF